MVNVRLFVVVVLALLAPSAAAQIMPPMYIYGFVTNSEGSPANGTLEAVVDGAPKANTTIQPNGRYALMVYAPGASHVAFRLAGATFPTTLAYQDGHVASLNLTPNGTLPAPQAGSGASTPPAASPSTPPPAATPRPTPTTTSPGPTPAPSPTPTPAPSVATPSETQPAPASWREEAVSLQTQRPRVESALATPAPTAPPSQEMPATPTPDNTGETGGLPVPAAPIASLLVAALAAVLFIRRPSA